MMMQLGTSQIIRRQLWMAVLLIAAIGLAAIVSALVPLEGAVVARGTIVVESKLKKIQHPSGGVVSEILTTEGAEVAAGDLLIRLDETLTRVNLDIVLHGLRAERARLARLEALRSGKKSPLFPPDLVLDRSSDNILTGEAQLTAAQLTAQEEQQRGLMERVLQLRQEVKGLEEQQRSASGQLEITQADLDDLRPLYQRGNVQRPRISALRREALRNRGAIGEAVARIAQINAKIAESELEIARSQHEFIAGIVKELRESETKIAELREKRLAAEDHLRRLDIRAPLAGTVHQLAVHTVGGVVAPGETLMLIVPSAERLNVEIRIKPSDIDQITVGQEARVRFSVFGRQSTEELRGALFRVAADLSEDRQTGFAFYSASVRIEGVELARLGRLKLVSGMPAEVLLTTEKRTLANYIAKPLRDQMQRAFREQ